MIHSQRILIGLLLVCSSALRVQALSLLFPHQIKDMCLVGQEGTNSHSIVTRNVSMAGNYVYCSGQPGLQTVDVTNPSNIFVISDFPGTSLQPNASNIRNGLLYLADWDPGSGLQIYNLSNPAQPSLTSNISTSMHSWEAEIFGNYLYLSIGNETNAGVVTYDLNANPTNPPIINTLTIGDRLMSNIGRYGSYMYFTHKNELRIYDVTNPASPQFVRIININSTLGNVQVQGNYLYVMGRTIGASEQGGLWTYNLLSNPSNPPFTGHWENYEPRDMFFVNNYCIVPASGSGMYTLNVTNPANIIEVANWGLSWPNSGSHPGYAVNVTGSGRFIYIGTTSGNFGDSCPDFSCPYYGARLYSVQIFTDPPIIANVTPDPENIIAARAYSKQLTLTQGAAPITWSIVQAPAGASVDVNGLVSGWSPSFANVGQTITFNIQATNSDGSDTESWNVHVLFPDIDFDDDGDCDQADFAKMQVCFSGPGVPYAPGCADTDVDADGDVDINDFNTFVPCINDANHAPGC